MGNGVEKIREGKGGSGEKGMGKERDGERGVKKMGKEKMGTEKRRRGENRDAEKGNGEKRMEKVVKIDRENGAGTRSSAALSPRAQHPRAPPRALSYRAPISQGDGPGCAQCTLRFGTRRSTPFLPVQRASRPGFLLSAAFSVFSSSIEGKPGGGGRTASFLPSFPPVLQRQGGQSRGFGTTVARPCPAPLGQRLVAAPMRVFWSGTAL